MNSPVEFGFVQEGEKLVEGDELVGGKNDPVDEVIAEDFDGGFLSEEADGIVEFDASLFAFVDFVELFEEFLEFSIFEIFGHSRHVIIFIDIKGMREWRVNKRIIFYFN